MVYYIGILNKVKCIICCSMMHKKKTSLVPLMDDRDDLVSNELVLDTELSGFDSQDGGRTATSPTYLTRRYQKNAILYVPLFVCLE